MGGHFTRPRRRGALAFLSLAAIVLSLTSSPGMASDAQASPGDAAIALEAEHAVTRILSIDADRAFGEYLGGECVTCHQQSGNASGIPPIVGLPADYTVQALVEYKLGIRTNDVMKLMTARLADDEIAALAAYFSETQTD